MVGLICLFPIGGAFADWINLSNAPDAEDSKYTELAATTFDMDSKAFKATGSYKSYYVWKNATSVTNYNNVTHTAGVISVTENSTVGNNATITWSAMHPYFSIYFDWTAKQAYDNHVVRIHLYIGSLYVAAHAYARTITLSAGGQTFYTTTLAQTDADNYIDENFTINVNDLRRAIIDAGTNSYFHLQITAQDKSLTIAGSAMYKYNCTKLFGRDDALFFVGGLACALALAGIFLVQPQYSLPFGGKRKGGF
jgi:hypothetical protein